MKAKIGEKYPDELKAAEEEELKRMPLPADNWFLHYFQKIKISSNFRIMVSEEQLKAEEELLNDAPPAETPAAEAETKPAPG